MSMITELEHRLRESRAQIKATRELKQKLSRNLRAEIEGRQDKAACFAFVERLIEVENKLNTLCKIHDGVYAAVTSHYAARTSIRNAVAG